MPFSIILGRVAALLLLALVGFPAQARDGALPPGSLAELRRTFTLGGSPIPPFVFRYMGDGNPADTKPIMVSVDAWAAIDSNQYAVAIHKRDGWISQTTEPSGADRQAETETYRYLGATPDGLLVAVTVNFTSGGAYAPATLHVFDAAAAKAFDLEGKGYDRLDLTILANYPLGDRWTGKAALAGDTVTITTEGGAAYSKASGNVRTYRITRP